MKRPKKKKKGARRSNAKRSGASKLKARLARLTKKATAGGMTARDAAAAKRIITKLKSAGRFYNPKYPVKLSRSAKKARAGIISASDWRERERLAREAAKRAKNPNPRKAKTGRWYKGPRGTKVRVRRSRGKFIVDVK